MIDDTQYTNRHVHPSGTHAVEVVAHERHDGQWDVFVFEPAGSCPELEHQRVDEQHIFITRIVSTDDLDRVARQIDGQLGDSYAFAVYFREVGSRRIIGKIQSHLQRRGVRKLWVRSDGSDVWELVIRRKDFACASEVVECNAQPKAV